MSRKYHATQTVAINGWECGTETEVKLTVDFTVTDFLRQTHESPEEPRTVEDMTVRTFLGTDEVIMPDWLIEKFTQSENFRDWLLGEAAEQDETARDDAADAAREMQRERYDG